MACWNGDIHQRGRTGANALHGDGATALLVDFRGHAAQQILQPRNHARIVVANLEQHFRKARDDARRTGIEGDAAGGPHRARAAGGGEALVDSDAKPGEREAGIPANRHPRGAGVVLFAGEGDAVLPDPDDGRDDSDFEAAAFERLALFDMGFEISDMPPAFALRAGAAGESGFAQRIAHGLAAVAVARLVDIGFGDAADIGAAAEEVSEMPFLVAPGRNFDGAIYIRIAIDDAGGFERIDHAERSIEPACVVLAFQMRPRQQFQPRLRAGAEDVADAVDLAREAGVGKPLHQPRQRGEMRLGESRLVNAGLVGADRTQRVKVGEDAGAIGA